MSHIYLRRRYIKSFAMVKRNRGVVAYCTPYVRIESESKMESHRILKRLKPMLEFMIKRDGETIFKYKRKRDLLVWRGQMVIAYLLSQGNVGTQTSTWKAVASENDTMPNMGDDSGDPLNNEFYPIIGSPTSVTYDFNPTVKPNAEYQTQAELIIEATIISDRNATLRKIGIIDTIEPPEQHIIFEDAVIPRNINTNDEIYIRYTIPL